MAMYGGRGISDMRSVSGEFLLSLQNLWRQRGDAFAKLGKADIVQKLEEHGGPEARKLFEKFVADVEKLQAQQQQKDC